jgi:hypothetical protein
MSKRTGEQSLNDRICAALGGWNPVRIEDMYSTGIPDINFADGWIESKDVPAARAPKRSLTVLRLPHYTPKQRAWHVRRHTAGGKIYVALEVARRFYLFRAVNAAQHLGIDWTMFDLEKNALTTSEPFDGLSLRKFLSLDNALR